MERFFCFCTSQHKKKKKMKDKRGKKKRILINNCKVYALQHCLAGYLPASMQLFSLRLEGEETLKYRCVCRPPHVEKFNIVSNDHGRTHKNVFSVFDRKFTFWANSVKKNLNCQFKLKFGT